MRIVVVVGICVPYDAISTAAVTEAELLAEMPGVEEVTLLTMACRRPVGVPVELAGDSWTLLRNPAIARADLVLMHWGVRYPLFDALPVLAAERTTVVRFHNMTPSDLVTATDRPVMEDSRRQIELLALADCDVWAVSPFNAETLATWGLDDRRVAVVPIVVEPPGPVERLPRGRRVRLLAVGRLTPAKGVDVLVRAFTSASERTDDGVELRLVGSAAFADERFVASLDETIEHAGVGRRVERRSDVDDDQLWRCYGWADVVVSPSLHEGLCVPIVEGYAAGCRAIGTDAGNISNLVCPPDPIVPAGDDEELADAIVAMAGAVRSGATAPPPGAKRVVYGHSRAAVRSTLGPLLRGVVTTTT